MKRWRMNRMGILNFWLYDEEVFELEQGRLLFRGANGSGEICDDAKLHPAGVGW